MMSIVKSEGVEEFMWGLRKEDKVQNSRGEDFKNWPNKNTQYDCVEELSIQLSFFDNESKVN